MSGKKRFDKASGRGYYTPLMSGMLLGSKDLFAMALRHSAIDCEVPASAMPRVAETAEGGTLRVTLAVEVGDADQILVTGTVEGTLALQCQRCLESADIPVSIDVKLAVSASDSTPVPAGFEQVTGDARTLLLRDLLEDDILLALPAVPMHDDPTDCGELVALMNDYRAAEPVDDGAVGKSEDMRHPFAALKKLQSD